MYKVQPSFGVLPARTPSERMFIRVGEQYVRAGAPLGFVL